ncbi:hypothetical protein BOTBODRAFT_28168 [Botryobasidium botryosum FD-172 SS1]|uniref:FAD-binding domain-containing protein n=1 Tax=Botryobasidium botryosum (strain FD-172 SS1) TaxID=930990 RepID=A0A067MVF5_BOTB1|nr:hypothetical protein BOTBODRAFT_28168 [Botryobasidium botryosum FD-172 SS1]
MTSSNIPESNVDVLVVGAGPAGVFLSLALARAGVSVRVIDKRAAKVAAGQADGIQPRTLEVLQSYGLTKHLIDQGNQMHMAAFYNPGPDGGIKRTGRAPDVTAPSARFPFEITLHQGAIEKIFRDAMKEHGLEVDQPMIPISLEISDDEAELSSSTSYPVKVVLRRLDAEAPPHPSFNGDDPEGATEIVHAKYAVGADGAHSWVRKTLGITMDGESTSYVWGVVDTIPETDFPDIRNRCAIHSTNGSCMVIPREGDTVRLYVQMSEVEVGQEKRLDKSTMGPEKVMDVARASLHPYTISFPNEIQWWTVYIIGQRVASRFSVKNRAFIVGDACHTHSPKAGQGMNASMNDSHNLAWKLVHVLRGWADPSLLRTYEFERRKFAQDLIDFDKKFAALFSGKPRTEENQDGVSHEDFLEAFQTFGGFTSGIGIHYQPSNIVKTSNQALASNLVIGQRLPPQIVLRMADFRPFELQDVIPSDTRFKILIFAGDTRDAAQRARLQALADGLDGPEGFLRRYTPQDGKLDAVFDLVTISHLKEEFTNFIDVPARLRFHWSKVFTDDVSLCGKLGGKVYSSYGISPERGALVVCRPDGYVGMVAALDDFAAVGEYFATFMRAQ